MGQPELILMWCAQIEAVDADNARLVVRLALGGNAMTVSQYVARPMSSKEYEKFRQDSSENFAFALLALSRNRRTGHIVMCYYLRKLCLTKVLYWPLCIYVFIYLFIGKYVCGQHCAKTTEPICMKFSGMMCTHPRTSGEAFGSNRIKGQGQGHEKVKIVFSS